jgi:hypothetical protein
MDQSVFELVASNLIELGEATPANIMQTMLICDGCFAGFKFSYDGGHAILRADRSALEFFNAQAESLKTVSLTTEEKGAAA